MPLSREKKKEEGRGLKVGREVARAGDAFEATLTAVWGERERTKMRKEKG